MDSLSYGALVASQFNREQTSPSYGSPTGELHDERDESQGKLIVRFPGQQRGKLNMDRNASLSWDGDTSLGSPGSDLHDNGSMSNPRSMCGASPNSVGPSGIPLKRPRGRPRKLNPDGSYATNHIPLSNNLKTQQYNRRYAMEHPRNLIPELCHQMYKLGWMAGTGGSMTIRHEKQIFITPSGVSKERLLPQDLFVLDDHGNLLDCPVQEKKLKMTDNAIVFLTIYSMRNAGSIIHSHSPKAVIVTLIFKEHEFRITHQETIKGMKKGDSGERYGNEDTLVIPIIENLPSEKDLTPRVTAAMQQYPMCNAVLIRRHGLYVWGETWQSAKSQAECLDYLFDLAIEMNRLGIDPAALPTDEHGITE